MSQLQLECGRSLLAPTGVIKWEQGHKAPPSLEKQKLWGLVQKTTPVCV